jgi:DNA-binding response OmpR family regulator
MNNSRWQSYHDHLRSSGNSVRLVFDGIECASALRKFRPNVLVLDPNIPWGGGDGVLAIRDEEPELDQTQVMILTAGCDSSLLYRMSNYAIDDLVWQPVSASLLQQRLERLLKFQRAELTVM